MHKAECLATRTYTCNLTTLHHVSMGLKVTSIKLYRDMIFFLREHYYIDALSWYYLQARPSIKYWPCLEYLDNALFSHMRPLQVYGILVSGPMPVSFRVWKCRNLSNIMVFLGDAHTVAVACILYTIIKWNMSQLVKPTHLWGVLTENWLLIEASFRSQFFFCKGSPQVFECKGSNRQCNERGCSIRSLWCHIINEKFQQEFVLKRYRSNPSWL